MTQKSEQTYDYICFSELAYEWDILDADKIEHKIKRRLAYYNLGSYDQEKIDSIRQLKKDLYEEISLQTNSKYFHKSSSEYADLADFDIKKMTVDFLKKYPRIASADMSKILNFAIYLYYMR